MKRPELLSPAGNMECLVAAVEAGCDAVYIGGYTFGARNYAGNFSNEEIIEAVKYCHLYGVKVYVTVNTLVYDDEVEMFMNYVDFLHTNNVDAVIMQDLGMMDLVRKTYPNLEIHASTQMHIHNLEGVKFASDMGLKRVVLARETNYELLKEIKEKTNIELEIFIHGALCISYSGECLMSYMMGGRSGNRGTCAQACRMKYDLISDNKKVNEEEYLLSTKDLNTIEYIPKLIDTGIDSLKIEGRMKRPEYVYLITSLYRKAIDNYIEYGETKINDEDILEMKKIFNREFTKGFLFNEDNNNFTNSFRPNHIGIPVGKIIGKNKDRIQIKLTGSIVQGDGIRVINNNDDGCTLNKIYMNDLLVNKANKNDIIEIELNGNINDEVVKTSDITQLKRINELINLKKRKIKVDMSIKLFVGKEMKLVLSDGKNIVECQYGIVEQSNKINMKNEDICKQIKKLGNTIYEINNLDIERDENIFVKISDLNELRRQGTTKLNNMRMYNLEYKKENYYIDLEEYDEEKGYSIIIDSLDEYNKIKNNNLKYIYTDNKDILNIDDDRIIYRTSRVLEKVDKIPNSLNTEIGSLYLNKGYSDTSLNIVNSYSVAFLHSLGIKRITLSYELTEEQIKRLVKNYEIKYNRLPNLEVVISDIPEVMIMKYDLLKKYGITNGYLLDNKNRKFKVIRKNNITYIYNYERIENNYNILDIDGINTFRTG